MYSEMERSLSMIKFRAYKSTGPITEEEALDAQAKWQYLPQGYGFYDFKTGRCNDGTYWATWNCSSSCE